MSDAPVSERLEALRRADAAALGQPPQLVERAQALLQASDPSDAEGLPESLLLLVARDAVDRQRVAFLAAASEGPKLLRRLVKKELYRLESEGRPLELPRREAPAPSHPAADESLPAFLSPVDIDGRRTFIAPHAALRGFEAVLGELSDVEGVARVELAPMPRREYRKFARELSHPRGDEPAWLEVPPASLGGFIAAAREAAARHGAEREGSSELSRMFPGVSTPAASRSWPALDAEAERALVARGAEIFAELENARWLPAADVLRSLAQRIDEVASSRIVLDEAQRRQQLEAALERTVGEHFTGEVRALWAERLFRQADYFEATGRHAPAVLLAANARAFAGETPIAEVPLARALFQKALFEQTQAALARLPPEEREKLLAEERSREALPEQRAGSPLIVPGR